MDMIDGFHCSVTPSPHDDRDYIYESIKRSTDPIQIQRAFRTTTKTRKSLIPNELDLRVYLNKPRSQGSRGTCAAFSASAIKEYQERVDVDYGGYMSPEYIYFFRSNKPNSGMYGRDVMSILLNKGSIPERDFMYSDKREPEVLPGEVGSLETKASDYKISKYAKINTVEGLKEALFYDGACLICVPVYRGNSPTIWKPRNSGDKSVGGHAMVIVGYTKEGFIIRNSWGSDWNKDGHVIFPYGDWGCQWEVWSAVDAKSDRKPEGGTNQCCIVL